MTTPSIESIDRNFVQKAVEQDASKIDWISATDSRLTVRGLAWFEENSRSFCRLPHRAEGIVRKDVWHLSQAPASARIAFRSNSVRLALRIENHGLANMPHFAVTGSDGAFVYEGSPYTLKPWNMIAPPVGQTRAEKEIAAGLPPGVREFTIYLPLYAPLKSIEIGLAQGASIERPTPPRLPKPVVFYGTSITQGGCASTAGGDFVSAVGRHLNLDVINLGFSGNGRGEPELARLISEIDAAAYVLDYCANTGADGLQQTLPEFVRILREQHPATPILLISKIHYYQEYAMPHGAQSEFERQRDIMLRFYAAARASGDQNLHYTDGWSLVQSAEDMALVDGVHPTSLGFALMARRLAPQLAYVLNL